jgi:hypothetical protein
LDIVDKNRFLIELSESRQIAFGKISFEKQDEAQRVFSAIWELESEVNNGGFDQYFRNSDSAVIAHAPNALCAIGAGSCAKIVEQAIQVIAPLPKTKATRCKALDELSDDAQKRLEDMDAEFLKYPDNLTDLLFEFVRLHPETFGPVSHKK